MRAVIKSRSALTACFLAFTGCAHASSALNEGCDSNPSLQNKKSAELLEIVHEDQADRSVPYDQIDWTQVNPRDLKRRTKVAAIFAEGCLKSAADYASAALIFQHGTTADHFYQTFIWANDAVKLGDSTQRWMVAAGLDRYLVKISQKQLFGTQLSKDAFGNFCIQPVEPSFPDTIRIQYIKINLEDSIVNTLKGIGSTQLAQDIKDCNPELKPSPKGTVPGFW
jgi:hypothetical protein